MRELLNDSGIKMTAGADIEAFLSIHAPEEDLAKAPPVFTFKRKREIALPWVDLLAGLETDQTASAASIRRYFERSWGLEDRVTSDDLARLCAGDDPLILVQPAPQQPAPAPPRPPRTFYVSTGDDTKTAENPIKDGIFLRHGQSGRHYVVIRAPEVESVYPDLSQPQAYDAFWKDEVVGVSIAFELAAAANAGRTKVSQIDLRAAYVERRYAELQLELDFAQKIDAKLATVQPIKDDDVATLDPDEITAFEQKSYRLRLKKLDAERKLRLLAVQAEDLGFVLFLQKPDKDGYPPGFPEAQKQAVIPGKLYKVRTQTVSWTVQIEKPYVKTGRVLGVAAFAVVSGGLGALALGVGLATGAFRGKKLVDSPRAGQATLYDPVNPREDLAELKRRQLEVSGKEVYIMQTGPNGLTTAAGITLASVMARCDSDEDFRQRCVIFLPAYETSTSGERALTGYTVFENALPGIAPRMLPRLSFLESLSFRSVWNGAELGELAAGVNLAPGERRVVTISREVRRETVETRSTASVFDLSRSDTSDFSSEMENEVRRESDLSTESEASAGGSGSPLGVPISASAKSGVKTSLKNFSSAINKAAKKAAHSLNTKNRQEVSTSQQTTASVAQTDVTTATLENINQGRTLNLFFHRLYNRYRTGLYVDDLAFDVISGTEVIAGSGVYESRSFGLHELGAMLQALDYDRLPFELDEAGRSEYGHRVIDAFYALLVEDYVDPKPAPDGKTSKAATAPPPLDVFDKPMVLAEDRDVKTLLPGSGSSSRRGKSTPADLGARVAGLSRWFRAKGLKSSPMIAAEISVLSDALYLEAMVGTSPATEPYSERMRNQEVKMREAQIFAQYSEGVYKQAQAARLTGMAPDGGLNAITGYLPDVVSHSLTIALRRPLGPGRWQVCVNGDPVGTIDERWTLHQVISIDLADKARVLEDDAALKTLELREAESERIVTLGK